MLSATRPEGRAADQIANLVLMPKKNGKSWMCVDYTSLNKACLKDPFAGCKLLSFLDAYSGYHQIPLTEADQPATTFITPFRCFCYIKMSFKLNNIGTTC
jgi:hypothetical protein